MKSIVTDIYYDVSRPQQRDKGDWSTHSSQRGYSDQYLSRARWMSEIELLDKLWRRGEIQSVVSWESFVDGFKKVQEL